MAADVSITMSATKGGKIVQHQASSGDQKFIQKLNSSLKDSSTQWDRQVNSLNAFSDQIQGLNRCEPDVLGLSSNELEKFKNQIHLKIADQIKNLAEINCALNDITEDLSLLISQIESEEQLKLNTSNYERVGSDSKLSDLPLFYCLRNNLMTLVSLQKYSILNLDCNELASLALLKDMRSSSKTLYSDAYTLLDDILKL